MIVSTSAGDRRSRRAYSNHALRQHGVSLIEVLIAMLLVALGTLAIVLLQLSSKRNNLDAMQRAEAAQLAANLLERMRGNNSQASLDAYLDAAAAGFPAAETDCSAVNADCVGVDLAFWDAEQFKQQLDGAAVVIGADEVGGLISPVACLSANPPGGVSAVYTITIVWRGTGMIANDPDIDCGEGSGDYGPGDVYRRVLTLNSYIASL